MAKIKNISGQDLRVPWLGDQLVPRGKTVDVPAETVFAYTQQEQTWRPADDEAHALHDEMLEVIAYVLAVQEAGPAEPPTEDDVRALVAALLADTNASELIEAIKGHEDVQQLRVLVELETRAKRPRSTVLEAATKRIADLDPEDDDDTDDDTDDEES